ncbi:MAG: hypothetical protein AAGH92_00175 [Planctomycetota bacterium]
MAYPLMPIAGREQLRELGRVRFGWRRDAVMARFELADRFVTTSADRDNQWHYELGDTAEWFLQPIGRPYYWEFYATPNGFKSAMRWPGGPRKGVDPWLDPEAIRVVTGCGSIPFSDTTGNAAAEEAEGWWAEFSIRLELLSSLGDGVGPGSAWRTLAARYDHAAPRSSNPELSCYPPLPRADFHDTDAFAPIRWC